MFVNHFRLRHIRNLRRPADVSSRGQQRVLHHRPQQHIRRKRFRRGSNRRVQFLQRKSSCARVEFLATPTQWLSHSVHIVKKQRGFAHHLSLRVKSVAFQLFRSRQQRITERLGIIQRPPVNPARKMVQPRIQRIQKKNPPPPPTRGHHFPH